MLFSSLQTVSENASIRDRVEFLQEASVMKWGFINCRIQFFSTATWLRIFRSNLITVLINSKMIDAFVAIIRGCSYSVIRKIKLEIPEKNPWNWCNVNRAIISAVTNFLVTKQRYCATKSLGNKSSNENLRSGSSHFCNKILKWMADLTLALYILDTFYVALPFVQIAPSHLSSPSLN